MPSTGLSKTPRLVLPDPGTSEPDGTNYQTDAKSEEGPKPKPRSGKRIAILGTAPETSDLAPFADPEWEIWTCSGLALTVPKWDVHFELHDYYDVARGWTQNVENDAQMAAHYLGQLAQARPPQVVMLKELDPKIPAGRRFPIERIFAEFPERYFSSTVSYMIALAILEGAQEIGLWGVDMALSSEQYSGQRASAEWLLGYARGLGIKVTIPPESDLLKVIEPYAYGTNNAGIRKIIAKKKIIEDRLAQAKAARSNLETEISGLTGALDGLDYVSRCWQGGTDG